MVMQIQPGSSKRPAEAPPAEEPARKKIHPFFTKGDGKSNEQTGPFRWLAPLGKNKTCLQGRNLEPKCSPKVAAFDLDGTLIKFKGQSSSSSEWEWWNSTVPSNLQKVIEEGYTIAILSNQAIKPGSLKQWKDKVASLALKLKDVPFWIFAATAKDEFRKPMLGMWRELEKIFKAQDMEIDLKSSFFVGDAAGRQYKSQKPDFSSTDRKLALNIGIPFMTPEEYFLNLPAHPNYILPGFHVSTLQDLPPVTPTSLPIIPHAGKQEIVLFCGYPALGKSRFYLRNFHPAKYTHINQDTLKTRDKCIKTTGEALKRGESCVVDNTNRDIRTRKFYVDMAKEFKVSIRCFVFTGSMDLAWHNNLYRTFNRPASVSDGEAQRVLVPYGAFASFREQYEEPTMDEEFAEIRKVNWKFEGTDEEKRHWSMWLQIDGK